MSTTSTTPTVKTRILLVSDTHFFHVKQPDLADTTHAFSNPLPTAEILIHAGDLTSTGLYSENFLATSFLRSHPAELKLVIAGNHDVTLDESFYLKKKPHMAGDEYPEDIAAIKALYTSPEAVANGIRYMDESTQTFTLSNGARFTVHASPYTPAFSNWGFAYRRGEDRFNDSTSNHSVLNFPNVDIMITHGPPQGVSDKVEGGVGGNGLHVGCEHLWKAVNRARPKLHVFGHIHEGWGAEKWIWEETDRMVLKRDVRVRYAGRCVKRWGTEVAEEEKQKWIQQKGRFLDFSATGEVGDRVVHGESTMFVNASIMNVAYEAVNAPWVLDLDLPLDESESS